MRFPQETCSAIHDAAPNPLTVRWPVGHEPEKRRVYYLQKDEEIKEREERAKKAREYSPDTCAQVMENMKAARYGRKPKKVEPPAISGRGRRKRHRSSPSRPGVGDPQILVLDTKILEQGWEATVVLYEDPDPVRHTGLKTKVRGTTPREGQPVILATVTETEQEQIIVPPSRREREDSEDAFSLEHRISVDDAELARTERRMREQRCRGKGGKLAQEALERARRRAALSSAARGA